MGSKKLKRKKLRSKRPEKYCKYKADNSKKNILFESFRETNCEENLLEKNSRSDRLSPKDCSRSYIVQENIEDVKYFAKVREDYFRYLQRVVSNNCLLLDSFMSEEMLENLTLELEQSALLACLQVEIYKKSMLKIIKAINKSTEEKQVHKDVRKLLPDLSQEKNDQTPENTPECTTNSVEVETYHMIPTIAFSRTEDNLQANNFWSEQSMYNEEPYYSVTNHCEEAFSEHLNDPQISQWGKNEISLINQTNINNWSNELPQISKTNLNTSSDVNTSHSLILQNDFNEIYVDSNSLSCIPDLNIEEHKEVDPLSLSRNQLQKLVEQTLIETEKINRQKRDEQERACIAHILEGDDSLDERLNDSLSDNENECKENIDESNLMDRLEKMKQLFGMEDGESQTEITSEKPKEIHKVNHLHIRSRRPTIWKYEKFIQLHKYSIIAREMTFERRQINQKVFLELFGEDSDEEHEVEFSSPEKYRSSCTERISSWVVKYLMPFYHDKRILGRNVFKSLGHYISETIVDEIQYPDEWTVKYFVSKFFPPKKKYVCDADILNFQLDCT